ncbi:MAG: hypothetical protein L0Z73_17270, partial [Gammaproteobacteria bacterium]|nr:hypothetical protein [Gammaproteobacteria bacterium]
MNQRSVTAHESTATEAILSIDGRIKRRIPNYETVVVPITEKREASGTLKAVNDDCIIVPVLLDSIVIDQESNASPKRRGVSVIGVVIVLTFIWSMYSLFFLRKEPAVTGEIDQLQQISVSTHEINHTQQIKNISDLILQDKNWNDARINSMLQHWRKLDAAERGKVKNFSWFQHFTYSLNQQVKQNSTNTPAASHVMENSPLIKLALALGVTNSKGMPLSKPGGNANYQALIAEIKNEITQVERATKKSQENAQSEAALNAQLRKKLAAPSEKIKTHHVSDLSVKELLENYKDAYESGNLPAIAELFGVSLSSGSDNGLKTNFENVFRNSSTRTVAFHDYTWEPTANGAIIKSKYNGVLEFAGDKGTQNIVAEVKIVAVQKGNLLKIISFELLNSRASVTTPKLDIPSQNINSDEQEHAVPQVPNAAQLQDLTTQLVTAYETGDLALLTS